MSELGLGDVLPSIELPLDDGGVFRAADHAGQVLVIYFYPKDDTSGCTVEAVDFTRLAPDFQAAGAAVIGVSPDSVKSHTKFKAKHSLAVSLAADEKHEVAESFGVWKEKSMYGRKYMGVERSTFLVGPDGRIDRIWRQVSVPGHAEQVLEAVRRLSGHGT